MSQQDTLTDRYGAPSVLGRRMLIGWSVVLVVAFLGWLVWTAVSHSEPEVSSAIVTYDVVDEHTATARVDVQVRDEGVVATCLLRAYSEDHTVVGEKSFEVTGDASSDSATYDQEIRTERRATSVELVGCTTPGQQRPR